MKVKKSAIDGRETNYIKNFIQQYHNKRKLIKKKTYCERTAEITESSFGGFNYIGKKCKVFMSDIGYGTYIDHNSEIFHAQIGKYCSVASNVSFIYGHHPVSEMISMSPAFYSKHMGGAISYVTQDYFQCYKYANKRKKRMIIVGNDVWIGNGAKIFEGVTIGDGAIIGAGALVPHDVEPYSIYAGVPAKKINQRFDDEKIEMLMKFQWWNRSERWIMRNIHLFHNPSLFFEFLKTQENEK